MAYQHKQPAYIPCFYTDIALIQARPQMERYTGLTVGTDEWGVEWTYEENIHACIDTPGKHLFSDIEDWREKVHFPELDDFDWEKQADIDVHSDFMGFVMGYGLHPREDGKSIYEEDKARVCMVLNGMFERMHACMGFENALMALVEDPDECHEFFKAIADWKCRYFQKIGQYYDIDIINAHDDYGSNDRMFMDPELWRKILKPELARMVQACHDAGMIYQHHSCGYVEPIIPDLIEIGVDALDTLQACNTHLPELKKKYGDKLTFCGGFDNMGVLDVPGVSAEAVKKEYDRVIDSLAPGGSYVIYPIGGTFDFVGPFMEEHYAHGMNFYQNLAQKEGQGADPQPAS